MAIFRKSRQRIRREAADWVARLGRHPSAQDHSAFQRWRDSDPRHGEAYDRIAAIWVQAGQLAPSPAAHTAGSERRRATGVRFALAASLAAVILVSILVLAPRLVPGPAQNEPMLLAAAIGDIKEIGLPDGSRLTLDSASRVEAVFTGTERSLTLKEGRARFQVMHDARPFVVRASSSEIVATGTLFDVSLIGGRTAVVLLEGSVEVRGIEPSEAPRAQPHRLRPGQKLVLPGSAPPERRKVARGDTIWPSRMLEFDETRLDEATLLANRYSKLQLRLGSEHIRSLRVTGAFRAGDTAGFAQSLAKAFNLRIIRQPDGSLLLVEAGSSGPSD